MRRYLTSLLLASALALPLLGTGCSEHRYYDPYYHDYHRWAPDEDNYYRRWEGETHREHREWGARSHDEQNEYWKWRHEHGDKDHEHDKH